MAAFAVAAILRDMGVVSFWLPENPRQVPQELFTFGRSRGAFQSGHGRTSTCVGVLAAGG